MDHLHPVQQVAIWVLPILFAITVHESAHGWVAHKLGDSTAKALGRLSFNPIKHIDPLGTVILPVILLLLGGFVFGWAKPVPVNMRNLHKPRRDMALVAVAGPAANLLMAVFWVFIYKLGISQSVDFLQWMGQAGITINLVLMALNILPILPLDGGRIVHSLLPPRVAQSYERSEPFGFFIILALLITGMLHFLLEPVMRLGERFLLLFI